MLQSSNKKEFDLIWHFSIIDITVMNVLFLSTEPSQIAYNIPSRKLLIHQHGADSQDPVRTYRLLWMGCVATLFHHVTEADKTFAQSNPIENLELERKRAGRENS